MDNRLNAAAAALSDATPRAKAEKFIGIADAERKKPNPDYYKIYDTATMALSLDPTFELARETYKTSVQKIFDGLTTIERSHQTIRDRVLVMLHDEVLPALDIKLNGNHLQNFIGKFWELFKSQSATKAPPRSKEKTKQAVSLFQSIYKKLEAQAKPNKTSVAPVVADAKTPFDPTIRTKEKLIAKANKITKDILDDPQCLDNYFACYDLINEAKRVGIEIMGYLLPESCKEAIMQKFIAAQSNAIDWKLDDNQDVAQGVFYGIQSLARKDSGEALLCFGEAASYPGFNENSYLSTMINYVYCVDVDKQY